ncbi:hypothetical protein [Thermohalobacter berrensis]|uniref:Uncharacterized protein n=1 Tax=Thermohalobacter berrensis TaxID=99594 RepID=A0A419SY01_9FIRM|nr:hypothetical protein [Thermohalobacter berrensis]RKD30076.1 hypothetical protein BET03_05060 [Thermohalobacter berrensis]
MYNSFTVKVLFKLWYKLERFYETSLLRKITDNIIKTIIFLYNNSFIGCFIKSEKSLIASSFIFKIYCRLNDLIMTFSNYCRKIFNSYKKHSLIYRFLMRLSDNKFMIKKVLKNSLIVSIVIDVFTIDEETGGEQ